jgi:hypothetical protein
MLRRVELVRTEVSEERSTSIIGVTRIVELGKLDGWGLRSTETSGLIRATGRNIPEGAIPQIRQLHLGTFNQIV